MAITIVTSPQDYNPVYNPIYFEVSSTNVAQCSFKFVADLYINTVLEVRLFAYPEGANDYGVFRLEKILQDYITHDLNNNLTGFAQDLNSSAYYYIEFREEYDTNSPCTGVTTVSAVLASEGSHWAWNGAIQHNEFVTYDSDTYKTNDVLAKFLTDMPDNLPIGIDEQFNLSCIQTVGEVNYAKIITYNEAGTVLGTYKIANGTLPGVATHITFGAGPAQLNLATLLLGSQPVIDATVHHYDVSLWDSGSPSAAASETKRFKIDDSCTNFVTKRLNWFNRLGGFDSFSFKLKSFRNVSINRSEFTKLLGNIYAVSDRGRTVLSVNAGENLTYNTDWLTEDVALWLEELFTSPEVYIKEPNAENEYQITASADNGGSVDITLSGVIPIGSTFTYAFITNTLTMVQSGSGTITGYAAGVHQTNVACLGGAGGAATGTVNSTTLMGVLPVIVKSSSYEEKRKVNKKKIQYSIDISPSHNINIQRQ